MSDFGKIGPYAQIKKELERSVLRFKMVAIHLI